MTSFDCTNHGTNLYTDDLKCKSVIYYINCILSVISIVLFIPINLLSLTIFYEYSLGKSKNNISKTTSKPEVALAFTKIFITIIFVFVEGGENVHYILIFSCLLFTFITMCFNFYYIRYNKNILNFLNQFLSFTLFWASFILLIGKFTRHTTFDGCLGIFFITEPIFCFIILIRNKQNLNKILKKIKYNEKPSELLEHIQELIYLVENKDLNRNCSLTLNGYIILYEEDCIINECALKKYLNCLKFGNDGKVFLFQHIEYLFSLCLSRFPNSIEVRFAYSLYLLKKMNKRKHAEKILKGINELNLSLEQQFLVYRCKRFIEDELNELISENHGNFEIIQELEYKNLNIQFYNSIYNASNLYINFWNQLLLSHSNGSEDLTKLNECGTEINNIVEDINKIFEDMQNIKKNDINVLKLYSDFTYEILNDKEKGLKYKLILEELNDLIDISHYTELENMDLSKIGTSDKYQYIIVSGNDDSFGTINKASLSISEIFGYKLNELIGKNLDIIMPEIYHKEHNNVLKNKISEYKRKYVEETINYKNEVREIKTFGKNKSKYLINLTFKVTLINTEFNEIFFVSSFSKDSVFFHTNIPEEKENICYIITNKSLFIQNFTPNAVSYLGLTSSILNNDVEITFFIKQFYEDFLNISIENEQLNSEQKLNLKKKILNKKYKSPIQITWRKMDFFDTRFISSKIIELKTSIHPKSTSQINNIFDDYFILTVNEIQINNKNEGFVFKFEKKNFIKLHSTILPLVRSDIMKKKLNYNSTIKEDIKKKNSQFDTRNKLNNSDVKNTTDNNIINYSTANNSNINNNFINNSIINSIDINPDLNLKIDNNFVPESKFNFKLNINKLIYEGNENDETNSLRDYMKNEIMKELEEENKRKILNKKKEEENEEEEEEENDEVSDYNESSIDNEQIDIIKDNINLNQSSNLINHSSTQNLMNQTKTEDEYYRINFSHIKFSKYDYSKNMLIEDNNWEKITQVEKRIQEATKGKEKEDTNIEDNNNESLNIKKHSINYESNLHTIINQDNEEDNLQENSVIKEIEYALKKQESQESISLLNKISILVFLIFIGIGGLNLFFIFFSQNKLKKIGNLVTISYRLLVYNSVSSYYVKELILLNNENYTSIPSRSSREKYINSIYKKSMDIFFEMQELITLTSSSTFSFSDSAYKKLYEDFIETENIQSDLSIKIIQTTMQSSFIEASTALYNILIKNLSQIIPTEQDTYFFLKNSLNILLISYKKQCTIFMDELYKNVKFIKKIWIISYWGELLILILIYFILIYAYNGVAKKKESYIEVFFEIGTKTIRYSLEKCENFSKKIHSEDDDEFNDSISYNGSLYSEENLITQLDNSKDNNNNFKNNKKNKPLQLSRIFKIKIIILLIFINTFLSVLFLFCYNFFNQTVINAEYFEKEIIIENSFYEAFNSLREYIFDINSTTNCENSFSRLTYLLEQIYVIRKDSLDIMNHHKTRLPYNFEKRYNYINSRPPCTYRSNEYFLNIEECINFENGGTQYGYIIMNSYLVEEIRFIKDIYPVYINTSKPMNNLTLTGIDDYVKKSILNEKELLYYSNDPIIFFNVQSVVNLNIMMQSITIPFFINIKQLTIDVMEKFSEQAYLKFVIAVILYISIIFLAFIFIWIPFIRSLNSIIYKTKNMLSIIPKEVLASLSNIEKLLGIEKKLNGNNIQNQ